MKASGSNTFTAATLTTADIANSSVTYAKIQNETNGTLLGNSSGSAAAPSEQTLGATLQFSTSSLQTKALTGDITSSANSFVTTVTKIAGTSVSGTTGSGNVVFDTSPTIASPIISDATISSSSVTITGGTITGVALQVTSGALGNTVLAPDTGDVVLDPSSGDVVIQPAGNIIMEPSGDIDILNGGDLEIGPSGTLSINPSVAGTLNNIIIGGSTPLAGSFTALNASSITGGTGAFTTLSASSTVSGTGFSTYLASPPAIGGTAPSTGAFTNTTIGSGSSNYVFITGNTTGISGAISFQGESTTGGLIYTAGTGNITFQTQNTSATQFRILHTVNAVNFPTVTGSASGAGIVTIAPTGSDTNIVTTIKGKGTGGVAILGTSTNDSAVTGYVGEKVEATVLIGSAVAMTSSGTTYTITSISLGAGDWDVTATIGFAGTGSTITSQYIAAISTVNATLPTAPNKGGYMQSSYGGSAGTAAQIFPVGTMPLSINGTTTVYLVAQSTFGSSTMSGYGYLYARRVR